MKKNGMKKSKIWGAGILIFFSTVFSFAEEFSMSGDFSWISTYVWRGIRQFEGNALQGTVTGSWKCLSFGVWYSSVSFGDGTLMETDPFLNCSFGEGSLTGGFGMTYYSYDFRKWNGYADQEIELTAHAGFSPLAIALYYVPKQASTEGELERSNFWIELSSTINALELKWGVVVGYGNYSSRYLDTPKKEAIGNITLSANKAVTDQLSVGWCYEIPFQTDLENSLWINCSLSY